MIKTKLLVMSVLAALSFQAANAATSVYLKDTRGVVAKNSYGQCWRTGYWNAVDAANDPSVCECDPQAVAAVVCQRQFAPVMPQPMINPPLPQAQPMPPMQPQRISLSEDVAFEFGKYVLLNTAKAELDNVVNAFNAVRASKLVIAGNTDRIGSDAYNMKLGLNRANAVRDYLVSKGLPFNYIETTNAGKSNPITGNMCNNMGKEAKANKKLVSCLAPDRRVDIYLFGTRK